MVDSNASCLYIKYIKYIGKQQSTMVETMRATIYDDGVKRIKAKIEVPMDIEDVSNFVLHALSNNVVDLRSVQTLNKRELLQLAKDEVKNNGVNVNASVDNDTTVIVKNYVKQMVDYA